MMQRATSIETGQLQPFVSTSGLQRLAGVHDPPKSCDIPINAEFYGDCDGGDGGSGNG